MKLNNEKVTTSIQPPFIRRRDNLIPHGEHHYFSQPFAKYYIMVGGVGLGPTVSRLSTACLYHLSFPPIKSLGRMGLESTAFFTLLRHVYLSCFRTYLVLRTFSSIIDRTRSNQLSYRPKNISNSVLLRQRKT